MPRCESQGIAHSLAQGEERSPMRRVRLGLGAGRCEGCLRLPGSGFALVPHSGGRPLLWRRITLIGVWSLEPLVSVPARTANGESAQ
ncbi:hypothetical protein FQZ97_872470 [compost metagenome]